MAQPDSADVCSEQVMTDHGHADRRALIDACTRHRIRRLIDELAPVVVLAAVIATVVIGAMA